MNPARQSEHPVALMLLGCAIVTAAVDLCAAQVLQTTEAEKCTMTCAAGRDTAETIWASGGRVTPAYWGRETGDSVEWTVSTKIAQEGLKLAIRYSYAAEHYRNVNHGEYPPRQLNLIIDGAAPITVAVPDTGWWDLFETTHVDLPRLALGAHTFRVVSPAPHATTNLDCFILYRGTPDCIPATLRSTIVRLVPSTSPATRPAPPHFVIRMTPKAVVRMRPEIIIRQFERIWDHYEHAMGWTPPAPVGINIIEDRLWPNPGATAFQNGYGVFFRAGVMHQEQGNWCHEMTHMFYVAHFPGWFDESSVHAQTIFNWVPALFPKGRPESDPTYRAWEADARRFLSATGETTDNMVLIQNAVRVRYGPEVFSRFFHACVDAGRQGDLDFTPGRHLTKTEIVKYMSVAAGENVGPIYRRWRGFDDAP